MKVLLLDEPAAGMNPTETAELLACIQVIRKTFGIAILLIEHDMSLVMNICERIQVIDYGQTIASGRQVFHFFANAAPSRSRKCRPANRTPRLPEMAI